MLQVNANWPWALRRKQRREFERTLHYKVMLSICLYYTCVTLQWNALGNAIVYTHFFPAKMTVTALAYSQPMNIEHVRLSTTTYLSKNIVHVTFKFRICFDIRYKIKPRTIVTQFERLHKSASPLTNYYQTCW